MAQLGQTLTDLTYYEKHLDDPTISNVGHSGQYSDLINPPTRVSQFANDVPYAAPGSNVSQFSNGRQYTVNGSSNNQFSNDANYAVRGERVSEFVNDVPYVTAAQIPNPASALWSGPSNPIGNVVSSYGTYGVQQTNLGLALFASGLSSTWTSFVINHGLPANSSTQTYIGFAQAFCPDPGVDCFIACSVFYVNSTYFKVNCQQQNGNANGETHGKNDMMISWQMSLVDFGYTNSNMCPPPAAPPGNYEPPTANA